MTCEYSKICISYKPYSTTCAEGGDYCGIWREKKASTAILGRDCPVCQLPNMVNMKGDYCVLLRNMVDGSDQPLPVEVYKCPRCLHYEFKGVEP